MSRRRSSSLPPGLAAARAHALDGRARHQEWLDLTEVSGPFLTMPVLLAAWPQLDSLEKTERTRLRARHADWQADPVASDVRDEWIAYVLGSLLEWGDALILRRGEDDDLALDHFTLDLPEHGARLRAAFALGEPGGDGSAADHVGAEPDAESAAKRVRVLGMTLPAGTVPTVRTDPGDGWLTTPADRLAKLLRHHRIPLGLVTDGRWWCLVWAPHGGVTTTALFDAITWNEAAERVVVRAFASMLCRRRFFEYPEDQTLTGLLKKSLEAGEEVTEALGVQVRRAVELLVDAIGRADARAMEHGAAGLRADDVSASEVYRAAVSVMMRVVFLFFAEERGLLPADREVYARAYSARTLRTELRARADAEGEASLEHTTSGWHRLLALFHAVHGGVAHPELPLPAYDGSLFDPDTYPWLERRTPLLAIDDRTVLHMLQAVQEVRVGAGRHRETRTLSFRALSVEQIGYVYEGLLSFDGERATETMVGLIGPEGYEHEVPLRELEGLAARAGAGAGSSSVKTLAKKIHETWKDPKPPASAARLEKLLTPLTGEAQAEARRLLGAAARDVALVERLLPFAGLIRPDLRGLPTVIPNGSLFVTESSLRKNTGTHYTPRELAETLVHHALEPLVYVPGPLQTADTDAWVLRRPEEILSLKVADVAMGSAAFLVAACRYLADKLIESWDRYEGREAAVKYRAERAGGAAPAGDVDSDGVVIEARRQIIEHCLYGADINPMAVEMAKLSLWLVSMDPERPFTFLDDRLVTGDSLLGVTSVEQLGAVHLDVEASDLGAGLADIDSLVAALAAERRAIAELGDDLAGVEEKRARLAEVRKHTERLRLIGDLVAGAGLATCASGRVAWYEEDGGERLRDLFPRAAELARRITPDVGQEQDGEALAEAETAAREWLASELPDGALERVPLHWPLEFPEVFTDRGGFDAVVGNPPFLGGPKVSAAFGPSYRGQLVDYIANGVGRTNADLVAYFLLRIAQLTREGGQAGVIATSTVAQGDTREVGLDQLVRRHEIRRAIKSARWPSRSVSLEYCAVWFSQGEVLPEIPRNLDGADINAGITAALNPETRTKPWVERLESAKGVSFNGANLIGEGFQVSGEQARSWLSTGRGYERIIFPYLNGRSLNSDSRQGTDQWVINFGEMGESEAREYVEAFRHLEQTVKEERAQNSPSAYPGLMERWWQYWRPRGAMFRALRGLDSCLVMALVSNSAIPVRVSAKQVFTHALAVFAEDGVALLALLSSAPHYWWAVENCSTMKRDLRYAPTDAFETLVRPQLTTMLDRLGGRLDEFRRELMLTRDIGLTATYNLVHNPDCDEPDIVELRRIHTEIDRATIAAYGWDDLLDDTGGTPPADPTHRTVPLDHGFHDTDQGTRYTIGLLARTEIIDRLRQLNHQAYADEVLLGLHKKPKAHPEMPAASAEAHRLKAEQRRIGGNAEGDFGPPPEDAIW
ncbi:hypothetical protein GCM10010400_26540 [Streptomyces aculeolatus]|uniref:Eco57I restriction-modification methylase domain-containing protein n=1 Tax=Streptomyces aculeolatus TaxID=270689 RepID=UPI001CEC7F53|nr:hypothetical protein [Streptomyces aculeolatus]